MMIEWRSDVGLQSMMIEVWAWRSDVGLQSMMIEVWAWRSDVGLQSMMIETNMIFKPRLYANFLEIVFTVIDN